jgi:hypothetical protein
MIEDDESAALFEALGMGAWEEYVKLVGEFDKARGKGALWPVLARAHPSRIDLLERLLAWPAHSLPLALRRSCPCVWCKSTARKS